MWYKKGAEAKEALQRAEALSKALKEKGVPRFWLKPDEKADVIFVDDDGFWCEVHVVKIGDTWKDITCSAGLRPCPICLKESRRPTGVTYFSVIDLRQFVKSDGTVVKNRKVLLPARRTLAKQIFEFKEMYGSLVGLRFSLKRYTDKDANCGIIVGEAQRDVNGKVKIYKLQGDLAIPFDYEKVLAPPTPEELQALGYTSVKISSDIALADIDEPFTEPDELDEDEIPQEDDLQDIPDDLQDIPDDLQDVPDDEMPEEDDLENYLDTLIDEQPKAKKKRGG